MAIAVSRFTSSSFGAALDAGGTPLTIGVIPTPDRALRGEVPCVGRARHDRVAGWYYLGRIEG